MKKSVVFWDNDGVLVDTEKLYFLSNRQVLLSAGIELSEEQFHQFYLKESRGAWHMAVENGVTETAISDLREERNQLYGQLLMGENLIMAGASEVLEALTGRVMMGVVTSSRRQHFEMIHTSTGFDRFFDFVITCDDVAATKPDPEPYLLALEKAGCNPNDCVVIEDSERGLVAAKAAGLECWIVPGALTRFGDFSRADRVLDSIADVVGLLDP